MYKAIFMEMLEKDASISWNSDKKAVLKAVRLKKWNVVYAKAPFGSPDRVVEYNGRYTHKIAITRHRILEVTPSHIKFSYKDYADGYKTKQMLLSHQEFLKRFEQHNLSRLAKRFGILPKRFVKINGYLRLQGKTERLEAIRASLDLEPPRPKVTVPVQIRMLEKYGRDITKCKCCHKGSMVTIYDSRQERRPKSRVFNQKQAAPS
jgi:hypothetical protein